MLNRMARRMPNAREPLMRIVKTMARGMVRGALDTSSPAGGDRGG